MSLDLAVGLAPLTTAALAGPAPSTWTATVLTAVEPVDPAQDEGFDPNDVSPGVLGFLVIFAAAVACIPLFWSMTAKLRKVDRRARLEEESAGSADEADEADGTGQDGPRGSGPEAPGPDRIPGG